MEHHVDLQHVFGSPAPPEVRQLYGRFRPRVEVVGELVGANTEGGLGTPGAYRLRARASVEYANPELPAHADFNKTQTRLSLHIQHRRIARDWALGIEYFTGHDHYNVEFIRNVSYVGIGLSWYPISVGFL